MNATHPDGSEPRDTNLADEFTLPYRDAVSEAEWELLHSKGVCWLQNIERGEEAHLFQKMQMLFGVENVFTGDGYSTEENRPLRLRPDRGIYIRVERRHDS